MSVNGFLTPVSEACRRTGPNQRIVLSSRVRLARNIQGHAFPGWAKKAEKQQVLEQILPEIEKRPCMDGAFTSGMDKLSKNEKQILVERHLISREHAENGAGSGLICGRGESISIMINEEDHLQMQSILPGLQIEKAWEAVNRIDSDLEERLPYAFSPERGYLTACPTNLGTAMRVSAMLHLPGLVLAEQINAVMQAVNKLGMAVRGLYGEGTEALGNLFQVSNQMTLGESEGDIIERLNKVLLQMMEHEENARTNLVANKEKFVLNHIGRAYGTLSNAHSISSKEAMNLLSMLRLGHDYGLFSKMRRSLVEELFILTRPAHLRLESDSKLSVEQRDILRADMLRSPLRSVPRPAEEFDLPDAESDESRLG